jgi:hypothetical protein
MTPNPYQSPREAGYDTPKRPAMPLWRRMVRVAILAIALGWLGIILFFLASVAFDYASWWIGF